MLKPNSTFHKEKGQDRLLKPIGQRVIKEFTISIQNIPSGEWIDEKSMPIWSRNEQLKEVEKRFRWQVMKRDWRFSRTWGKEEGSKELTVISFTYKRE